jgi:hypothetical protein
MFAPSYTRKQYAPAPAVPFTAVLPLRPTSFCVRFKLQADVVVSHVPRPMPSAGTVDGVMLV